MAHACRRSEGFVRWGRPRGISTAIVQIQSLLAIHVRTLASTESVRTLGLHVDKLRGALISRCILVRHSWLHHFLQPLALVGQIVHRIVLLLQSILEVGHHTLLNFFQLFNASLVSLTNTLMLQSLALVHARNAMVVVFTIEIFCLFCIAPHI